MSLDMSKDKSLSMNGSIEKHVHIMSLDMWSDLCSKNVHSHAIFTVRLFLLSHAPVFKIGIFFCSMTTL